MTSVLEDLKSSLRYSKIINFLNNIYKFNTSYIYDFLTKNYISLY